MYHKVPSLNTNFKSQLSVLLQDLSLVNFLCSSTIKLNIIVDKIDLELSEDDDEMIGTVGPLSNQTIRMMMMIGTVGPNNDDDWNCLSSLSNDKDDDDRNC